MSDIRADSHLMATKEARSAEHASVGRRLALLIEGLKMTQDQFAKVSTTLERSQISMAVNGGTLAKTEKWILGVARAANTSVADANDYLRGRINLETFLGRRHVSDFDSGLARTLRENGGTTDILSPNKQAAMAGYPWDGVEPPEYEAVHHSLAKEQFATGIDAPPSYWTSRIKKILAELRGTAKTVHQREPVAAVDLDAESPEVAEARATRKAKKRKR